MPDVLKAPAIPTNTIRDDERLAHQTGTCTSKPSHLSREETQESAKKSSKVGKKITRHYPEVEIYLTSQPQRLQTVLGGSTSPSRTVTIMGPTTLGPTREVRVVLGNITRLAMGNSMTGSRITQDQA